MNFEDTYSRMANDELMRLTSQWATLTEPAQVALAAEMQKRKLGNELKAERQIALEEPPSSGTPSPTERVMFVLFVIALPCAFLLPRIWPENMRYFGLYELLVGVSYCWMIWLIVWLVLRARRIEKTK